MLILSAPAAGASIEPPRGLVDPDYRVKVGTKMILTKETPASLGQHLSLLDEVLSEIHDGTFDVQTARAAIESSVDLLARLADQIEVPGSEPDVAPTHECTASLCQPGLALRIHGMECDVCFETVAWPELPFHYNEHFELVTWAELSAKNSAVG